MMNEEMLVASILEKMPDLQITVSDLKAPTAKFIQSYFITFLSELGVDAEKFQLTKEQTANMTSPNSIQHMVPLFQLFGAVSSIAKSMNLQDFSFTDITEPKHKRTMIILNHFNSFHSYADMLAERVQDDVRKMWERKAHYNSLLAQVDKLQKTLEHQNNMEASNDNLKQEIGELKKKILQTRQEMSETVKNIDQGNSAIQKLEMDHKKKSSEYNKMSDQIATQRAKTVYSPDVDHMDLKLGNLEKQKSEGEARIQELQSCLQQKCQRINVFKKYISDLEQGTQGVHINVELLKQNKKLDEELQVLEKEQSTLANKEICLKEKLAKVNAKVEQMIEQKRMMKTVMEQELAEGNKKIEETKKELEGMQKKESCVDLKKKISELEEQIKQKVEDNNKLCDLYDEKYKEWIEEMNAKLDKINLLDGEQHHDKAN